MHRRSSCATTVRALTLERAMVDLGLILRSHTGCSTAFALADGNASFAPDGALKAFIDAPEGTTGIPLKQLRDFGAYELVYDVHAKGRHVVRVELHRPTPFVRSGGGRTRV